MSQEPSQHAEEIGHEPTTLSGRAMAIATAVLFGVIVLAILLMGGLSRYLAAVQKGEPTVGSAAAEAAPPPPGVAAVTSDQIETLRRLRSLETTLLTQYAWIDLDNGVARIPIERAMEIMAQQPVPTPEMRHDAADDGTTVR